MMRLVLNTTSANAGQALATALRKIAHYHGAERVFVFHARPDGAFQLTEEWARQDVARLDPSDAILPATALNRWKVALTGGFSVDLPAGTQFPQTLRAARFLSR